MYTKGNVQGKMERKIAQVVMKWAKLAAFSILNSIQRSFVKDYFLLTSVCWLVIWTWFVPLIHADSESEQEVLVINDTSVVEVITLVQPAMINFIFLSETYSFQGVQQGLYHWQPEEWLRLCLHGCLTGWCKPSHQTWIASLFLKRDKVMHNRFSGPFFCR